jgi:hypothetical protein
MLRQPELRIEYGQNNVAVSATCSACHADLPRMKAQGATAAESMQWFTVQFSLHMKQEHPKESRRGY